MTPQHLTPPLFAVTVEVLRSMAGLIIPPSGKGEWSKHMRTASLALGIIGGVFGIIAGLFAMTIGGVGAALEASDSGTVTVLGFAAVFIGVLGIVGGAVAPRYPKAAATMQLISCVAGFVAVSLFWIFSGILLLIGAGLAFLGRNARPVSVK